MKTSFQKAERVAQRVSRKLGSPDSCFGRRIEVDPREGFALSVRVAPGYGSRVQGLAPRFDGVRIRVLERQMARPREPRRATSS